MAVPKKRHSKSKVGRRRAQQGLKQASIMVCKNCGGPKTGHRVCKQCGKK